MLKIARLVNLDDLLEGVDLPLIRPIIVRIRAHIASKFKLHNRLVIGLRDGQGGTCLQHLHLILLFVEKAYDFYLVVIQCLVDHQVLCSECKYALHVLKLYAVDDELLKLLV